jgi:short subunit dehydrogenase-like uncharacterized protein
MGCNILVYGATGFSGQLIAAEGKAAGMSLTQPGGECQMILAARRSPRLRQVGEQNGMEFRAFHLDDVNEVTRHLDGIDVIINAAGPFSLTAEKLAKAALEVGCHYVDIGGEVDVYRKLDDLGRDAVQRKIALVAAAGYTAAASDILLDCALDELKKAEPVPQLGAIRIAMSSISGFSAGSAQTLARSMREQVLVIRNAPVKGKSKGRMVVWHEPVGKLERTFDFGDLPGDRRKGSGLQIASAANLVDTLTARLTVSRHKMSANAIETYVQLDGPSRVAYQVGGMFASLGSVPWIRALTRAQLSLLSREPGQGELEQERNVILLEIEDVHQTRLIDWRWETPNVYQFTAQLAVATARNVCLGERKAGWITPANALGFKLEDARPKAGPAAMAGPATVAERALRNARLEERPVQ